jgi:hypothetical protein
MFGKVRINSPIPSYGTHVKLQVPTGGSTIFAPISEIDFFLAWAVKGQEFEHRPHWRRQIRTALRRILLETSTMSYILWISNVSEAKWPEFCVVTDTSHGHRDSLTFTLCSLRVGRCAENCEIQTGYEGNGFLNVKLCSLAERYRRFGGTCCF